jgi:DNA-directed RNA polymerase subunit RPC12/RpoP
MAFVAAICPQCGGELQLDNEKDTGFCMHCGSRIVIRDAIKAVRIDNSHMIDTWMHMGNTAYEADNLSEAYDYYTKILEAQPDNWKATLNKAKSAAWQSTLANFRIKEALVGFAQAYNLAPENEKEALREQIIAEVDKLSFSIVTLRSKRFVDWPDEEEVIEILQTLTEIKENLIHVKERYGLNFPVNVHYLARIIQSNVVSAYKSKIIRDYNGDDKRPDEYQWRDYLNRLDNCVKLLLICNQITSNDYDGDIERYKILIKLQKAAIDSCSWDYKFTDYGKIWHKQYSLSSSAKQIRRNFISDYQEKIQTLIQEKKQKEQEEAKARFDSYWESHTDVKQNLFDRKNTLVEKIKHINMDMNAKSKSPMSKINKIND